MNKPKKAAILAVLLAVLIGAVCAANSRQILSAISGIKASDSPVITNAFLDKTKYVIGDQMLITASVEDNNRVKEVKAEIENEKGIDTIKLNLIGGDDKKGTYQAVWTVHDVTGKKVYKTKVLAIDSKEQSSESVLYWIDPAPNPGHTASTVGGTTDGERTFDSAGLYTFQGQVKIQGGTPAANEVLTSDANGVATWEPAGGGAKVFEETSGYEGGIGRQTYCINKGYSRAVILRYYADACVDSYDCCTQDNTLFDWTHLIIDTDNNTIYAGVHDQYCAEGGLMSSQYHKTHNGFQIMCSE